MRVSPFPVGIQIETTSRCNAKCGFCPHPVVSKTEPQGVMEESLYRRLIDEVSGYPVQLLQPFLNNDPLMDRQIVARTEYMARKNPHAQVCITTNGALLNQDIAEGLAELRLHTIHISSNGLTGDTYRDTMRIDGYTVLRNVNTLRDCLRRRGSRTRLVVTAILMKRNRDEVALMREYWRSRGVEFYLNPLNDRAGNIDVAEFADMLPFAEPANQSQLHNWQMTACQSLYTTLAVLWNGDVATCCMDWRRDNVMGNVRDATIREVWEGAQYRSIRALSDAGRLDERPLCNGCGHNRFSIQPDRLAKQLTSGADAQSERDRELLGTLVHLREQSPQLIQLGLMQ